MRTIGSIMGTLVVGLLLASSAHAISAGTGGRVYFTRGHMLIGDSYYAELLSVGFDSNWAAVGVGSAQLVDHGDLLDNQNWRYHSDARMPSPEIADHSGTYGKITMAMGYTNPTTRGGYTTNTATNVVAQLVEVTPNGSGMTPNIIGVGRSTGKTSTWNDRLGAASTEGTFLIYPDLAGEMVGSGNYLLYWTAWGGWLGKITDTHGDGDPTDNVTDYVKFNGGGCDDSHNHDYEILGDRLYETSGYRGPSNDDSVHWAELGSTGWKPFVLDLTNNAANVNVAASPELAVGKVDGTGYGYPGLHRAAWTIADGGTGSELYLFIDLNDDNDANDAGEQILAYEQDDGKHEPANWRDIELIRDAQGKMVIVGVNLNTSQGDTITFVPLNDNGVYDGSGIAYIAGGTGGSLIWDLGDVAQFEIKIDAVTPIPEPATILLVGTGVLGVFAYLRRRRMR